MAKILQDTEFEEGADEIVGETIKGIDEEKGRLHPTLTMRFTRGAMAHLARYVEAVADLPGDQPLWMRQDVRLEGGDSWYRVEVKIERLYSTPSPPDFHEEDYPEHIYPDWMIQPPPISTDAPPMGSRQLMKGFKQADIRGGIDIEPCLLQERDPALRRWCTYCSGVHTCEGSYMAKKVPRWQTIFLALPAMCPKSDML